MCNSSVSGCSRNTTTIIITTPHHTMITITKRAAATQRQDSNPDPFILHLIWINIGKTGQLNKKEISNYNISEKLLLMTR